MHRNGYLSVDIQIAAFENMILEIESGETDEVVSSSILQSYTTFIDDESFASVMDTRTRTRTSARARASSESVIERGESSEDDGEFEVVVMEKAEREKIKRRSALLTTMIDTAVEKKKWRTLCVLLGMGNSQASSSHCEPEFLFKKILDPKVFYDVALNCFFQGRILFFANLIMNIHASIRVMWEEPKNGKASSALNLSERVRTNDNSANFKKYKEIFYNLLMGLDDQIKFELVDFAQTKEPSLAGILQDSEIEKFTKDKFDETELKEKKKKEPSSQTYLGGIKPELDERKSSPRVKSLISETRTEYLFPLHNYIFEYYKDPSDDGLKKIKAFLRVSGNKHSEEINRAGLTPYKLALICRENMNRSDKDKEYGRKLVNSLKTSSYETRDELSAYGLSLKAIEQFKLGLPKRKEIDTSKETDTSKDEVKEKKPSHNEDFLDISDEQREEDTSYDEEYRNELRKKQKEESKNEAKTKLSKFLEDIKKDKIINGSKKHKNLLKQYEMLLPLLSLDKANGNDFYETVILAQLMNEIFPYCPPKIKNEINLFFDNFDLRRKDFQYIIYPHSISESVAEKVLEEKIQGLRNEFPNKKIAIIYKKYVEYPKKIKSSFLGISYDRTEYNRNYCWFVKIDNRFGVKKEIELPGSFECHYLTRLDDNYVVSSDKRRDLFDLINGTSLRMLDNIPDDLSQHKQNYIYVSEKIDSRGGLFYYVNSKGLLEKIKILNEDKFKNELNNCLGDYISPKQLGKLMMYCDTRNISKEINEKLSFPEPMLDFNDDDGSEELVYSENMDLVEHLSAVHADQLQQEKSNSDVYIKHQNRVMSILSNRLEAADLKRYDLEIEKKPQAVEDLKEGKELKDEAKSVKPRKTYDEIKLEFSKSSDIRLTNLRRGLYDIGLEVRLVNQIVNELATEQWGASSLFTILESNRQRLPASKLYQFCLYTLPTIYRPAIEGKLALSAAKEAIILFRQFGGEYKARSEEINNNSWLRSKDVGIGRVEKLVREFTRKSRVSISNRPISEYIAIGEDCLFRQAVVMAVFLKYGTLGEYTNMETNSVSNTEEHSARTQLMKKLELDLSANQLPTTRIEVLIQKVLDQLQLLAVLKSFISAFSRLAGDEKESKAPGQSIENKLVQLYKNNSKLFSRLVGVKEQDQEACVNWLRRKAYEACGKKFEYSTFKKIQEKELSMLVPDNKTPFLKQYGLIAMFHTVCKKLKYSAKIPIPRMEQLRNDLYNLVNEKDSFKEMQKILEKFIQEPVVRGCMPQLFSSNSNSSYVQKFKKEIGGEYQHFFEISKNSQETRALEP
jgi:hypothetical protein